MKGILQFDLSDIDDAIDFEKATRAKDVYRILEDDFGQALRNLSGDCGDLRLFRKSDFEYEKDVDGNDITFQTPIEKLDGRTMMELFKLYFWRVLSENGINTD